VDPEGLTDSSIAISRKRHYGHNGDLEKPTASEVAAPEIAAPKPREKGKDMECEAPNACKGRKARGLASACLTTTS
jgi:hypothetical protein